MYAIAGSSARSGVRRAERGTVLACALWAAILFARSLAPAAEFPKFQYYQIDKIGNQMGQTSLVDIDKDGKLDWVVGCSRGPVWWFRYEAPDRWTRYQIADRAGTDVGGVAFDVDGDGWIDQVSGNTWFRNPGSPAGKQWARYENGAIAGSHDNVAADIDGDGKLDVVMMSDKAGLFWYKIPKDPTQNWEAHQVGPGVHGGIAPRGVGDLDGDGDPDIVRSTGWFENLDGKGTRWQWHENIPGGHSGRFKDTTKSWICDLNKDGRNDVVMCDCDSQLPNRRAHWFENRDGKGRTWVRHEIAANVGDMHSLAVADFDGDGDLDVFSGEGPLGGTGLGGKRRWFIWENVDGKGQVWKQHIILEGPECHEAVAADVDGDGDIDICSKPWNGDLHVYLRNMLSESKPGAR